MLISGSPNLTNFDFEVQLDISQAVPKAIVTDISTYTGTGNLNIIGIVIRIVDPSNLILPQTIYPPNVDIYPGLTSTSKNLPYYNGQVKWGNYRIYATLIDQDGTQYAWTDSTGVGFKSINLCKPNSLSNATLNFGGLNLSVNPDCDTGLMIVQDGGTGFSYNGVTPSETETALIITYPIDTTGTTAQQTATFIPFTFPLTVSGIYAIQGTVNQTYQLTETTSVKAGYYYQNSFDVQCGYSLCKALCDFEKLWDEVKSCSPANPNLLFQKLKTFLLILGLLVKVQAFKNCGKKFGDLLEQFRIIGGFACNCECAPQGIAPQPLMLGGGTLVKGDMCGDIDLTLTHFLGNVKIDASDVSYEVVAAADQVDFVTITPTEGTCSKTFTISIDFDAAIAAAAITVCIDDTAFVTPCGDDETGELGNFLLPFATIKAAVASTTSNSGHHVHVYPGTYAEASINIGSDAVEKTGLNYYFEPGVTISSTGTMWFFNAGTGSVVIRGAGILKSTTIVIDANVAYDFDIECLSIESTNTGLSSCIELIGGGEFRLKCSYVKSSGGSCFDIRSIGGTGYVECDLLDSFTSVGALPAVRFKDVTSTGVVWQFKAGLAKSIANSAGQFGTITMDTGNTGNPKVYYYGNVEFAPTATGTFNGGIVVQSGTLFFEGDVIGTAAFGCGLISVAGTLVVRNSRIRVNGSTSSALSFPTAASGICILENCQLVSDAPTAGRATILFYSAAPAPTLQAKSCWIKNEDTTGANACISMNTAQAGLTPTLILDSCNLYSASATGTPLNTTVASNTRLTNCWANLANGGAGVFTNLLQAMNVDADLLFYIP